MSTITITTMSTRKATEKALRAGERVATPLGTRVVMIAPNDGSVHGFGDDTTTGWLLLDVAAEHPEDGAHVSSIGWAENKTAIVEQGYRELAAARDDDASEESVNDRARAEAEATAAELARLDDDDDADTDDDILVETTDDRTPEEIEQSIAEANGIIAEQRGKAVTTATPRRKTDGGRIYAGRMRSRATASQYAGDPEHVSKFGKEYVNETHAISVAITILDNAIDNGARTDDELRVAYRDVERASYEAWMAGVPTTVIGAIIGTSGGSARGRALAYAKREGLDAPEGRRTSTTREPTDPRTVSTIKPRYWEPLGRVLQAVANGKHVSEEILLAYNAGVPLAHIATVAGMTAAQVKDAIGDDALDADARKAARATLVAPDID